MRRVRRRRPCCTGPPFCTGPPLHSYINMLHANGCQHDSRGSSTLKRRIGGLKETSASQNVIAHMGMNENRGPGCSRSSQVTPFQTSAVFEQLGQQILCTKNIPLQHSIWSINLLQSVVFGLLNIKRTSERTNKRTLLQCWQTNRHCFELTRVGACTVG